MAQVRQDKVQIVIEFLTDESKSLGKHVTDAKALNNELKKLIVEEQKLVASRQKLVEAGEDTSKIDLKILETQMKISTNLKEIFKSGQGIEQLDLSKVAPTQLISSAKELARALEFIPKGTKESAMLTAALKKVNDQIATNRAETKGVAKSFEEATVLGSKFSGVLEVAFGVSLADSVQGFLGQLKEVGTQLFNRSKELEFFEAKAKHVFGESYNEMKRFAEGMSLKMGQSIDETMKDLAQTSNSFKTLEFDDKYIPSLTKQVYQLSAAWSSYNAGQYSVTQTSETLMKALGGEVDELNEIGIVLTEDTMKKELQKRGYDKLTGAAYDQAAALTLIELVTRKTKDAQQAFGNSSESIATKQNRINAVLQQSYDELAKRATNFFNGFISIASKIVDFVAGPQKTLTQSINETQEAFNRDIAVLQTANVKGEARKKIINDINSAYKQYLPSLITEKTTNEELNKIRDKGNALFKEQIFYMAHQSKLTEISQKAAAIQRELIELEMKRAKIQYIADTDANEEATMKQLLYEIENKRKAKSDELKVFQKEQEDFLKASKESAKQLGFEYDNLGKKWGNKSEEPLKIPIKKELDPKAAAEEKKKAYEAEMKQAEAQHSRSLALLEKRRIEERMSEENYQNEYKDLKINFFDRQNAIFKKYGEANSVEAANVAKQRVEIEKNAQEAILKLRLQDVDKSTNTQKGIAENSFLLDTENASKEQYEAREKQYKLRLLQIEEDAANEKIKILESASIREEAEEIKLKNTILNIKKQRRDIEQKERDELEKAKSEQKEKEIAKEVEAAEQEAAKQEGVWKRRFADGLVAEQEFAMMKLNIKRDLINKEIELLSQGSEAQKKKATELGTELVKIDEQIETQKIQNKKRTQELEKQLFSESANMAVDALSFAVDIMGQDEEARTKHASQIKALEVAQVWIKAFSEIQGIWKNANENPLNALIPGWGPVWAGIQTGMAIGRATAAATRINNADKAKGNVKYAEGGFTEGIGFKDETGEEVAGTVHEGEWVAPKKMVRKNPSFFASLERARKLGSFEVGGMVGNNIIQLPNQFIPINTPQYFSQTSINIDNIKELTNKIDTWQRDLNVNFSYSTYSKFKNQIDTDFKNAQL